MGSGTASNKQTEYIHSFYLISHRAHNQGKEVDINRIVIQICSTVCVKYQGREYGAIRDVKEETDRVREK